jgi:hypothetical protein
LGDFASTLEENETPKDNEIFWQRKDKQVEEENHHSNNKHDSASSASLNGSENGGASFLSGASSMSSSTDKPPLHSKHHKGQHATMRKQMRAEFLHPHKSESHPIKEKASIKRHHSSPRVLMSAAAAAAAAATATPKTPTKQRSHSHIMTPVQRTKSLPRKSSHELVSLANIGESPVKKSSHQTIGARAPSKRNILRNKRMLEQELNNSHVFHYVLHKGSIDEYQQLQQPASGRSLTTCSSSLSQNSASTFHSPTPSVQKLCIKPSPVLSPLSSVKHPFSPLSQGSKKMNLDQFLKMKQQSEELVQIQQQHLKRLEPSPLVHQRKFVPISQHTPQEVEDTWHHSHSLDSFLSNHEPTSPSRKEKAKQQQQQPFPALGQSLFSLEQPQPQSDDKSQITQDDSIIDDEIDMLKLRSPRRMHDSQQTLSTFMSSTDWKDLPSAWQESSNASFNMMGSASFAALHDERQSQSLSLSRDDALMLEDEDEAATLDGEVEVDTLQNSMEDLSLHEDASDSKAKNVKEVEDLLMLDSSGRRSVYSGSISTLTNMPHGMGRLQYPRCGETFLGRFIHGWWSGYGTCIDSRKKEEYTGYFLDYVKHGHGSTHFADGRTFEGTYDNGVMKEGKMTYPDESSYVGAFKRGARHGRGTYSFPNGATYFGDFRDDQFHSGTIVYPNGSRFIGQWKKGVRHGAGKEVSPEGSVIREGHWQDGRKI